MSLPASPTDPKPWGRIATFVLGAVALFAGQMAALVALTWWFGAGIASLPDFSGDGVAVTLVILVSTPVQVGLLVLLAQRTGIGASDYLGWIVPRRSEAVFGAVVIVAAIVDPRCAELVLGRGLVTQFQSDIYRTAGEAGVLPMAWLWFAVIVATPIGEETLFRGFLFRGLAARRRKMPGW